MFEVSCRLVYWVEPEVDRIDVMISDPNLPRFNIELLPAKMRVKQSEDRFFDPCSCLVVHFGGPSGGCYRSRDGHPELRNKNWITRWHIFTIISFGSWLRSFAKSTSLGLGLLVKLSMDCCEENRDIGLLRLLLSLDNCFV